jgi:MazG family protein
MDAVDDLVAIVARLRGEGGCPWDRAQTPETLRPYVLEEAYEVVGAFDQGDRAALCRELGDALFQIVLLARIAEEEGAFTLDDVARAASAKMVRRHPHVFDPGTEGPEDPGSMAAWEAHKARERGNDGSALDGVPTALPALVRAHRVSEKAAGVGFDWPDAAGVRAKVDEELGELDQAIASGDPSAIGEELGDLLFALVNLGRHLPVAAEDALRTATDKFERRFRRLESTVRDGGGSVAGSSPEALDAAWRVSKGDG